MVVWEREGKQFGSHDFLKGWEGMSVSASEAATISLAFLSIWLCSQTVAKDGA